VGYTENYAIDRKLSRRKQRISDGKEEKIYTLDHQRKYNTGLVAKQAVLFPFKKISSISVKDCSIWMKKNESRKMR
jgi:hypothetical protein